MEPQRLFQVDESLFLDLSALNFVRFEGADQDATAILKFKDGTKETLSGESACTLRRRLTGLQKVAEGAPEPTPVQHPDEKSNVPAPPSETIHLRNLVLNTSTMFVGRNKAWYYRKGDNGQGLFMAFVNAKGSCSVRPFDSESGMALKKSYGSGPYERHFAALIEGSTPLTVDNQPSLERDCKERLPEHVLQHLRRQIERTS